MASLPYRELKSALSYYAEMTGWRWNYRIVHIAGRHARADDTSEGASKPTPTIRLDLTPSDALALATVLNAAADPGQGREPVNRPVPILPEIDDDDEWLTTRAVAEKIGVAQTTITSWLSRGGPKGCPFPQGTQVHYRNYWQASVIDHWRERWHRPLVRRSARSTVDD